MLIHRINEDDYVCVTEQTSEMWVLHGIGTASVALSDTDDDLTVKKLEQDRINEKIKNINQHISTMYDSYEQKLVSVKKNYDKMYLDLEKQQKDEEKKILESSSSTSKEHISEQLQHIRDMYDTLEDNILQEKVRSFEILKSNHERTMDDYASSFESDTDVKTDYLD